MYHREAHKGDQVTGASCSGEGKNIICSEKEDVAPALTLTVQEASSISLPVGGTTPCPVRTYIPHQKQRPSKICPCTKPRSYPRRYCLAHLEAGTPVLWSCVSVSPPIRVKFVLFQEHGFRKSFVLLTSGSPEEVQCWCLPLPWRQAKRMLFYFQAEFKENLEELGLIALKSKMISYFQCLQGANSLKVRYGHGGGQNKA